MEHRLEQLETQIAFQEKALDDLNQVLIDQQRQMDAMERQIRILAQYVQDTRVLEHEAAPEPLPPHY